MPLQYAPRCAPRQGPKPLPEQLSGADRRDWEESIKATPGLKGRSMLVLLVLLDIARGKAWAFPSDEYLARKAGVSANTVWRALQDLARLGIVRIARARGRRWLVLTAHPHAGEFLADLGEAVPQVGATVPQVGGVSVVVNRGSETQDVAPTSDLTSNEKTPEPTAEPAPDWRNWRQFVDPALLPAPKATEVPMAAAVPMTPAEREAILAMALGPRQETPAAAESSGIDPTAAMAPMAPETPPTAVEREAATIEALARLKPGATRGEVLAATARLANLFNDRKSTAYYRSQCNAVVRGEMPARFLETAVRAATGPGVIRPGAAFAATVKRCCARGPE